MAQMLGDLIIHQREIEYERLERFIKQLKDQPTLLWSDDPIEINGHKDITDGHHRFWAAVVYSEGDKDRQIACKIIEDAKPTRNIRDNTLVLFTDNSEVEVNEHYFQIICKFARSKGFKGVNKEVDPLQ